MTHTVDIEWLAEFPGANSRLDCFSPRQNRMRPSRRADKQGSGVAPNWHVLWRSDGCLRADWPASTGAGARNCWSLELLEPGTAGAWNCWSELLEARAAGDWN